MKLGNEVLFEKKLELIKGKRVGVLAHDASRDSEGVHIIKKLIDGDSKGMWHFSAVFAPEHGLKGLAQDMEPVSETAYSIPKSGREIPVYSLYGENFASLSPTPEMIKGLDVLIVDLQDIGARYYTYANTMALCMRICSAKGVKVIVCDRPNPINGVDVEGKALLDDTLRSFVGMYPLPVRHGKTIGEMAIFFAEHDSLPKNSLEVVAMVGWKREQFLDETGIPWVNPSPNMRSLTAALLYPGLCLLEATNISEGRGTRTPFEVCGAPWIDGEFLAKKLRALKLAGVDFDPAVFTPTSRKFEGDRCEGVQFIITNRREFKPYLAGLALIHTIATTYPTHFKWRREPYEFVDDIPAIDILTGSRMFRKLVDKKKPLQEVLKEVY